MEVAAVSRADDTPKKHPERIVILDADDPMVEIHGRIVWQEEHDRVVEETRQEAYAAGYAAAERDLAAAPPQPVRVEVRRRRTILQRLRLVILIAGLLIFLLMLPLVVQNAMR